MIKNDKRAHMRMPVSLRVTYLSTGDLQKDLVTDLSPGGLFVRTSKPLPIGTEVELEVCIADEDPPMHVRGKVIWLRGKKGPHEGMGIQFTGVVGPLLLDMVRAAKKD
jgi:uncharacterized protein (TIGR02266 family)